MPVFIFYNFGILYPIVPLHFSTFISSFASYNILLLFHIFFVNKMFLKNTILMFLQICFIKWDQNHRAPGTYVNKNFAMAPNSK